MFLEGHAATIFRLKEEDMEEAGDKIYSAWCLLHAVLFNPEDGG
jgi:hypothetical protein